jgi:DNA-binding XRE family transcriptional regulator
MFRLQDSTALIASVQDRTALIADVSNRTLTLIEREDDTRSWSKFLIYFSHNVMPT